MSLWNTMNIIMMTHMRAGSSVSHRNHRSQLSLLSRPGGETQAQAYCSRDVGGWPSAVRWHPVQAGRLDPNPQYVGGKTLDACICTCCSLQPPGEQLLASTASPHRARGRCMREERIGGRPASAPSAPGAHAQPLTAGHCTRAALHAHTCCRHHLPPKPASHPVLRVLQARGTGVVRPLEPRKPCIGAAAATPGAVAPGPGPGPGAAPAPAPACCGARRAGPGRPSPCLGGGHHGVRQAAVRPAVHTGGKERKQAGVLWCCHTGSGRSRGVEWVLGWGKGGGGREVLTVS